MSKRIDVEISTTNKNLKDPNDPTKDLKIEVKITAEVPENVEEASEFYGGEEKLMDAIQQDVARRRSNAARPLLRDAESPMDWAAVAQQAVDSYSPGRRGGFGAVQISAEELAAAGDMDSLLALLRQRGVAITNTQNEEEESEETVGAEG